MLLEEDNSRTKEANLGDPSSANLIVSFNSYLTNDVLKDMETPSFLSCKPNSNLIFFHQ